MEWIAIKIVLEPDDIDNAYAALLSIGIDGVSIEDPREWQECLDTSIYYDYVGENVEKSLAEPASITFYVKNSAEAKDVIAAAKNAIAAACLEGTPQFLLDEMNEEDWANNWKQFFHPIPVGDRIIIKPSWEELDDAGGRCVLEIDPSSSFGTGSHATTRLCLKLLEEAVHEGDNVLDMGCGSGILGVGAALLGAGTVTGVDIEEGADRTAAENFRRNGIAANKVELICGNVLEDDRLKKKLEERKFDVIVANIVADVVIMMLKIFHGMAKPGARFILSGIITERIDDVKRAVQENGYRLIRMETEEDWAAMVCER